MPITSNASADEKNSSFFLKNKDICEEFDKFMIHLDGEVTGLYHAWSYNIYATVPHTRQWAFRIKKSTYSSGNLLLSSTFQNLYIAASWTVENLDSKSPNFYIRQKKLFDFFRILAINRWSKLGINHQYSFKSDPKENDLMIKLNEILRPLFLQNNIYSVRYEKPNLRIDLHSNDLHKEVILQLLAL